MLPKFKMTATNQLHEYFLWPQKFKKLNVRNYSNFTITFPTIWNNVQVIFSRFCWNSEWPPRINFIICCGHTSLKSEIIQILQSHHSPYGNVQVILLKFQLAATSLLFNYLWALKLKTLLMTGVDIWLQASCYLRHRHISTRAPWDKSSMIYSLMHDVKVDMNSINNSCI